MLPIDTQKIISAVNSAENDISYCANRNPNIPTNQSAPFSEPLIGNPPISSPFGRRIHPKTGKNSFHKGIDYAVIVGTMVYSPAKGVVVSLINDDICGKGVKLKHPDGTKTVYCHLSEVLVNMGEKISAGCAIAKTGNTGYSTGPHLHYSILDSKENYVNPGEYTKRSN